MLEYWASFLPICHFFIHLNLSYKRLSLAAVFSRFSLPIHSDFIMFQFTLMSLKVRQAFKLKVSFTLCLWTETSKQVILSNCAVLEV